MSDDRPDWARALCLPVGSHLDYARSLASVVLLLLIIFYTIKLFADNPKNLGKALRKRVLG